MYAGGIVKKKLVELGVEYEEIATKDLPKLILYAGRIYERDTSFKLCLTALGGCSLLLSTIFVMHMIISFIGGLF